MSEPLMQDTAGNGLGRWFASRLGAVGLARQAALQAAYDRGRHDGRAEVQELNEQFANSVNNAARDRVEEMRTLLDVARMRVRDLSDQLAASRALPPSHRAEVKAAFDRGVQRGLVGGRELRNGLWARVKELELQLARTSAGAGRPLEWTDAPGMVTDPAAIAAAFERDCEAEGRAGS